MTDVEQITDVLVRYATGIDLRDWDLFRTCFAEDCRLDYGRIGRWDDREAVTQYMILAHSGPSLHRLSNFSISVAGDLATARTYVDAMVFARAKLGGAHAVGYYNDELLRTDEGWKIVYRRHTSISMKFLGVLSIIPSWMVSGLVGLGSQRLHARIKNSKDH